MKVRGKWRYTARVTELYNSGKQFLILFFCTSNLVSLYTSLYPCIHPCTSLYTSLYTNVLWSIRIFYKNVNGKRGIFSYFIYFFLKNGPNPASFWFIFCSFSQHKDKYRTNFTINDKSIDGVLGSRTQGGMMEGADESTELWRHPQLFTFFIPTLPMLSELPYTIEKL